MMDGETTNSHGRDLESNNTANAFLKNSTVRNFSWKDLVVTVKDRETKQMRDLLSNVSGYASQGKYLDYKHKLRAEITYSI